jgi:hypothetical protein
MPTASDVTLSAILPRFLYDTAIFDGATITTNTEETTLPATNLQDDVVRRPWRTLGTTQTAWAVYDLGNATAVNCVGIFGHNLTSVALLTIQAHTSDSWGTPSLDVGLTIPTDADGTLFEKAVTFFEGGTESYRYWRLVMNGVQDGTYWEVGRLVAGEYFEPSLPPDLRASRIEIDPSVITRADGQQSYSRAMQMYRQYQIQTQNYAQGDRDDWLALFRNRGQRLPMMCAFDPTHPHRFNRDTIYGRMTTGINEALVQMEYGSLNMQFQEEW